MIDRCQNCGCAIDDIVDSAVEIAIEDLKDELAALKAENENLKRDAKKWRDWYEAQTLVEEEMPKGYYITMHCETQNWYLELNDPDGKEIRIDWYDSTNDFFVNAVEAAKEHAAMAQGKKR